jgi:Zinc-finger of the MIZ type in Nse subunit
MLSLPLVPRHAPVAPLNADAQLALADLLRQQRFTKRLKHHLTQAADQLTAVAEQLNERGTNYSVEYRKKCRRAEANGEEENQLDKTEYEDFQRKLQDLTRAMDNGVRAVVDDQTWVESLPDIMRQIARKAVEASQRQTQHPDDEEEDESATAYPPAPAAEELPSTLITTTREDLATDWASKTLTERYSQNNTYVGFYRGVHDAKNPSEDGPPIPHHSLWFANEEDINPSYVAPGTQKQRPRRPRGPSNEGGEHDGEEDLLSSDIEIAREKISIKCPITFLPFTDPLTSTRCPHSFDKPGIMAMLHRTQTRLPFTDAQNAELAQIRDHRARLRREKEIGTPAIPCPVCSIMLSGADLRPDPVLLRKVQRIQAAEAREREAANSGLNSDSESSDDEDGIVASGKGTQRRPVGLESSPAPASAGRKKKRKSAMEIQRERARSRSRGISVVPQTQLQGSEDREMEDD